MGKSSVPLVVLIHALLSSFSSSFKARTSGRKDSPEEIFRFSYRSIYCSQSMQLQSSHEI